jgi:hypothetical protein
MPGFSAIDVVNPAFERTKSMLFRPFRFQTWLKIGFIGWLAGAGTSGGFNYGNSFPNRGGRGGGSDGQAIGRIILTFLHEHIWLIVMLASFFLIVFLVFLYLSCRFRFILFDSVLRHDVQIARGWNLYARQANRYFGFTVCFMAAFWIALMLIVGLPLWSAFKRGVFHSDDLLDALLRLFVPMVLELLLFWAVTATIAILANDFVVPLMAIDDMTLGESWARVKEMAFTEPGAFAGYLGMKPVLSIAGGLAVGVAMIVVLVVLAIPAVILGIVIVAMFKGGSSAVVAVAVLLAAVGIVVGIVLLLIITLLASAPVAVFFTSYSLYFLGGRYPRLASMLWPQTPAPLAPPATTPPPPFPGAAPAI